MIRAAIRLLILYFLAWLLSTQWDAANTLYRQAIAATLEGFGQPTPLTIFCAFLALACLWHLAGLGLWILNVPLDRRLGPKRHPLPPRPLRIQLRFRLSRVLGVFVYTMFGFLLSLRALEALVAPASAALPWWLTPVGDQQVWLFYGAVHAAVAALAWAILLVGARRAARRAGGFGFAQFQLEQQPVARLLTRVVMFALLPLAGFAAISHPHELHMLAVLAALGGLLTSACIAQALVLSLERKSDNWLHALPPPPLHRDPFALESDLRSRTLRFLHPGREHFPAAAEARPDDLEEVAPDEHPQTDFEAEQPDEGGEFALESAAARVLAEGIACREAGEYRRARALLRDAAALGDRVERERAEAIMRTLPGSRAKVAAAVSMATALLVTAAIGLAWQWFSLPSGEETLRLARSAHIHVRKNTSGGGQRVGLLGTRYDYSLNTGLDNISPHFVNAVVASEDHRFFQHGVAYKLAKFVQAGMLCLFRKLNVFSPHRACRGNSTLPQQLARNLFLSEKRSIRRKLTELLWALKMETSLSKGEILELYMNRIYLGRGNFGIEMAARDYFKKSAASLSLTEAVYLAAAVKRPSWNWRQDRAGALRRAQLIFALMKRHGYADRDARFPASFHPALGRRSLRKPYLGHLWQWVRNDVEIVMSTLPDGDYKVLTSLNAEVEVYAERHLEAELRRLRANGVSARQGAVVVMRPDGEVLAMVGGVGADLSGRGINRAKRTRGMHARPPASSFKPFVYLAALETGLQPDSPIDARPVSIPIPGTAVPYQPRNHDRRTYGVVPMRMGLVQSINTAAVNLLHDRIGFDRLFDTVGRLGIDTSAFKRQWGLALGQSGVPLIEMVGAYAVFANGGRKVRPHAVLAVTTDSGKTVWRRPSAHGKRIFRRRDIARLNDMLEEVVRAGTGRRAARGLPPGSVVAGKTGTGDDFVDAWFMGFTADLVIGVWIGNDQPTEMPGIYGGTAPARAFNAILRDLVAYTELVSIDAALP